jgi:Ca2+-binding RTX toxin-like protein
MYTLAAGVEKLTGTSATSQGVYLNALDNIVVMGAGHDLVVLEHGGNDRVDGGAGDDFFYYGAAWTAQDVTIGGTGYDGIGLLGVYDITLGAQSMTSIEKLSVYGAGAAGTPYSYKITMVDANVAQGQQLMVVGMSLSASETLVFNGSAETNGSFNVRGGKGADTIGGGAKSDLLYGNLGADQISGGGGNDWFEYYAIAESTASARDTILDFSAGDRISLSNIDADSNPANGNGKFAWLGAGAFTGVAGQLRVTSAPGGGFLVEGDTNGDSIADLVIQVQTVNGHILGVSDFTL